MEHIIPISIVVEEGLEHMLQKLQKLRFLRAALGVFV
jgi:hypothetical protein